MATTRIKDISKTTTDLASDTYGVFDGATNGTQKMARNDMYADWAAAYVAAPTTYKLAPLNSGTNKIDATYLPTGADTAKGAWDANANSPALADGAGTAGDYYDVTTAGTQNLGSGNITFTVGDVVKYDGSVWYKIDSVANFLDGYSTAATSRAALEVNSKDEDAQANALKTTAPALYFDGSSSFVEVADDDKLTFSSSVEFGTTVTDVWSPDDNTPALTDGSGTLNQHYRVDSGAGTVTQGGSTLSVINGTATTAGQAVYYDGAVWRLKDVDDLPFTVSAFVNMTDATSFPVVSKYLTDPNAEWYFETNTNDDLRVFMQSSSGNRFLVDSTSSLTAYEGSWVHVAFSYAGAGPNSGNAFAAAGDGITMYVNGAAVAMDTPGYVGTYAGLNNTAQPVRIGRQGGTYAEGSIRDCKIFNRTLTASEVAELARGNDLGFSEEWGGAHGGVYTSDFSAGDDGWDNVTNGTQAGNIDFGGVEDVLRFTLSGGSGVHRVRALNAGFNLQLGKRYRLSFDYYIPSSNAAVDGIKMLSGTGGGITNSPALSGTYDTWVHYDYEEIWTATTDHPSFYALDGVSTTVNGDGDVFYITNFVATEVGTLASFSAERYDTSTSKLYDISDNAFVGTGTSVSLTGREVPVYETGTWTPSITFGGGSTGITYSSQVGSYTRIGNTVHIQAAITLTSVGTDTGGAAVGGLPFTSSSSYYPTCTMWSSGMSGLTSNILGRVASGGTVIDLYDFAATGSSFIADSNFTSSSILRFSATYQIQ
jgi:hypothetical protein